MKFRKLFENWKFMGYFNRKKNGISRLFTKEGLS